MRGRRLDVVVDLKVHRSVAGVRRSDSFDRWRGSTAAGAAWSKWLTSSVAKYAAWRRRGSARRARRVSIQALAHAGVHATGSLAAAAARSAHKSVSRPV